MNPITADQASARASGTKSDSAIALNSIYNKIRKASGAHELEISMLIPRDELDLYKGSIKTILEEEGYTVSIEQFKKIAPIMKSVGRIVIGW